MTDIVRLVRILLLAESRHDRLAATVLRTRIARLGIAERAKARAS